MTHFYAIGDNGNLVRNWNNGFDVSQRERPAFFGTKEDCEAACRSVAQPGEEFHVYEVSKVATVVG